MTAEGATAEDAQEVASPQPELGQRLRALRNGRSLALGEVATATGISKSFLSLVEGGRSDISIGRLLRLAEYFGVGLVDLLPQTDINGPTVIRRGDRRVVNSRREHVATHLLAADFAGQLTSMLAVFDVGGGTKDFRQHHGLEFVLVLAGQATIEFADGTKTVLDEGDSACFDPSRSHSYSNSGDEELQLLSLSFATDGQ
jgi:transcriptional regulator with XRE-family HTH domain